MQVYQINDKQKDIANYLGIAQKAGKIAAGDLAAENALKNGKACLMILAEDSGNDIKKKITFLAEKQNIPLLYWPDKYDLGLIVGKSRRGAIALTDAGFTKAILKKLAPSE